MDFKLVYENEKFYVLKVKHGYEICKQQGSHLVTTIYETGKDGLKAAILKADEMNANL